MNTKLAAPAATCRDCGKVTAAKISVENARICGDCKSKYLRTKPIHMVDEVLRLAREFVAAELHPNR